MGASQNRPETQRRGRGTSRWKEDLDKVVKPGSELEWRVSEGYILRCVSCSDNGVTLLANYLKNPCHSSLTSRNMAPVLFSL